MPGIFQYSIDLLLEECARASDAGISAVLIFGLPESKDEKGSGAYAENGIVQQAVRAIKAAQPNLLVVTDVCLCEYTSHGHCGLLKGETVDNDASLELIAKTALSHADAGADIVAPSCMLDFQVAAIRSALDDGGHSNTPIMAYSAKFSSAFYGPFREAAQSAPAFGDRKTYQMDSANAREAVREILADAEEGADMVMVKPAMAYMDIIRAAKEVTTLPIVAYNVSGEYAMVKAAAAAGWIDERAIVMEILTGLARAGADAIITYHALDASHWL
jgi:porphobilinogen synthase